MFIYLSKKIAIPNGVRLKSLSWNGVNGWIVCGGENGLLKVLKLEPSRAIDKKGTGGPSNLSMNQTLEGHNGAVSCVCWNENYRKLTTSDQYGLIIVWMLHKGMWFEEMINNRNKSTVRGMAWTADGQRICIVYQDGAVIVGSVDGNRLWGKELKMQLGHVEWSPDGRSIIFGTLNCEVHIYDSSGNYLSQLPLYCLDDTCAATSIIGIDWYDGAEGVQEAGQPTLAIGVESGRLQLMRHEHDESPVLIDTGLVATNLKWATNGSVLALAGSYGGAGGAGGGREVAMVQFYSPYGQHLRTLKVPGGGIQALSWEGGSLRVALAVESFIYFANIRPDYRWGFFGDTLVASYATPERTDSTVLFWNLSTDERTVKHFQRLLGIKATAENCVIAVGADAPSTQYALNLCNAIGSPVDCKYIDVEPTFLTVTPYHVVAASHSFVYVWQYRTLMSKLTSVDLGAGSLRRREGRERCFHIDDVPDVQSAEALTPVAGREPSAEPIIAVGASQHCLLVARESGNVLRYALPHLALEHTYTLRCRPQTIAINCDSTRAAIIDTNGVLILFDLGTPGSDQFGTGELEAPAGSEGQEAGGRFERKDVWDVKWAEDHPERFALMEKTRMYIFNGMIAEEPVLSSAYLCSFSDLEIRAVTLDQLLREPENPLPEFAVTFETQALREARELLESTDANALTNAKEYIDKSPHPRLWRLLAEAALKKLDFATADKAFVMCVDYMGVQFVKRCRLLDDEKKQAAEVAQYFGKFDEAEKLYRDMDRRDLALQMRSSLGDWEKVVALVQQGGGDDAMLASAWTKLGDKYFERQQVAKAAQHYAQGKAFDKLAECYAFLEDYSALERLIPSITEGSPLLTNVGKKLMAVGMSVEAVEAFKRAGDSSSAIDLCVKQHQWEAALSLAESHGTAGNGSLQKILAQYAGHLLSKGKQLHAVELYRKANQYTDAAKLLSQLGEAEGASRLHPLRAKKLFVMAALEVERMRKKMLSNTTAPDATRTTAQTLDSLLTQDTATGGDKWLDSSWKGAEAYHFLLLCQRQLYAGYPADAMKTAMRLREYEQVLPPAEIYSLIALTAFYSKYYAQCSKAFVRLQSMSNLPPHKKEAIDKLALSIFSKIAERGGGPTDPATRKQPPCHQCGAVVKDYDGRCGSCGTQFPACIFSGRSILDMTEAASCKSCKRRYLVHEVGTKQNCALCHHPLPNATKASKPVGNLS